MPANTIVRVPGPDPSVTVYPSRRRQILLTIGAAVFVAISPLAIMDGRLRYVIAGVAGILFFGLCLVIGVRTLIRGGPALVIDSRGITDTASAVPAGFVAWHQIAGLNVWTHRNVQTVSIFVHDPAAVLAAATPRARMVMRANIRIAGTPVNIPVPTLPLTAEELIAEIMRMRPTPPGEPRS